MEADELTTTDCQYDLTEFSFETKYKKICFQLSYQISLDLRTFQPRFAFQYTGIMFHCAITNLTALLQ